MLCLCCATYLLAVSRDALILFIGVNRFLHAMLPSACLVNAVPAKGSCSSAAALAVQFPAGLLRAAASLVCIL